MGVKLAKSTFPAGHTPNDFKCFGPPATKDGEFDSCKIADLGCFKQDGIDSNKMYHGSICQSKINNKKFVYFEWGRRGAKNNQFQFIECSDDADAQDEFKSQLLSKNLKRGQWTTIAGRQVLRPRVSKSGKSDDLYLVNVLAARDVGLPDGFTITSNDGAKQPAAAPTVVTKSARNIDPQTVALMQDLKVGTVAYTRSSIVGGAIPAQSSIDEARAFLIEAQKRVAKLGSASIVQQAADKELRDITSIVYSRIPKIKPVGAPEETWILSAGNIVQWQQDLDAYEQALYSNQQVVQTVNDPFDGMAVDMEWISPQSDLGRFIFSWWPNATRNVHGHLGSMKIRNAWRVERHEDRGKIEKYQMTLVKECRGCLERPIKQPAERNDLLLQGGSKDDVKRYKDTNTALLFHGTRSVNVPGIMRTSFRLPAELVGVVITGAMFGGGIYFADDWKKSAGYTSLSGGLYSSGSGGVKGRGAFMFACDTVLGEAEVAPGPRGYTGTPKGKHCIFGKAGHSGVQNNEWITFRKESTRLRYLVEFSA
jgi:hypothetical protein